VIPAILLVATFVLTLNTANARASNVSGAYVVEVIGHQWWWEVYYPDARLTTANEIHIPVGRPVQIRETSTDVIHSLWIPQLGGQMEGIPGRQTSMIIQASQPGTYRGECAEFCGVQHAHMDLVVVADSPDQFIKWLDGQKVTPPSPTDPHLRQGQQAFLGSACVYCHTIRGTNATGTLGPDLTHLASRQTIGAGTLPNTPGNLAGWIADAQGIKAGNLMPPMQLDGDQLQAVLDYLDSLK
jgi:cytochrome c oxidase subunit 2